MSVAVEEGGSDRRDEELTALRRRADLLGAALDVAGTVAWRWDLATDVIEVEQQSPGSIGTRFARTMRGSLAKTLPEDLPLVETALREALAGDESRRLEYRVASSAGGIRWYMTSIRRFLDAQGQPAGLLGATREATLRKQWELTLARNAEWMRSILETEPEAVTVLDPDARLQLINPAGLAMLEAEDASVVLGKAAPEFILAEHRDAFGRLHAGVMGGEPGSLEFEVVGLKGTRRWLASNAAPLRDPDGAVISMLSVTRDVTGQRQAAARLRLQGQILDTLAEGVAVMDASGVVRYANPAFECMLGRPRGSLAGEAGRTLLADAEGDFDRAVAAMREARAQPTSIEVGLRHAAGDTRLASIAATTVRLDGVEHWIGVVQDMTERKQLEREIIAAADREQERISRDLHDGLGQDLTGIALMLKGLERQVERGCPEAAEDLRALLRLVNEAIEGTRAIARGLSPVAVQRGGLAEALRSLAERSDDPAGVRVRFRCEAWPERLDLVVATHLYRIAQEALTNALRHARATRVRIALSQSDEVVRLRIADDGQGAPASARNAEGLGLRAMRYRAQMIGASLRIGRGRRGGTEVTVSCPAPQGSREASG